MLYCLWLVCSKIEKCTNYQIIDAFSNKKKKGPEKLETTRQYYISTDNKQLEDRTKERLKDIFAPKPVELDTVYYEEKLSETVSSTPRMYTVSGDEITEGAKRMKLMYDDISSGRILSIKVVKQEMISDSSDLKLLRFTFEDGYEEVFDVTTAEYKNPALLNCVVEKR